MFYMNYIYIEKEKEEDQLIYLYELKKGVSESSFALKIFEEYFFEKETV